jgi:hypothetical protein
VGYVVGELAARGKNFKDKQTTKQLLKSQGITISDEDFENTLDPQKVVESHNSRGGTSSREVSRMIQSMQQELASAHTELNARVAAEKQAHDKTLTVAQEIVKGMPVREAVEKVLQTPWMRA